ncbi:hypothetical protein PGUG_02268 [Meyerozyma guilliermondii ATCC 6260]|uniref:Signal recognition particle subunit SRP68 n=1 Tax=Meyerozyma guilliermondii (strain ATCC 6260 / CBS 566 / DSM 6381 / JCM 1539 / NBRC 10279 / NRRL Y-324) TaxID=294746 RepID=A5DG67_PICGU|nr:uncharacterized protein PGUG_02268 [Meyerozyma guilliermondii ATCC 6260]EDK38170.2 hypothetical protein PGUG_02268 [Meyerozyma guilliermondii ATCC 6260]
MDSPLGDTIGARLNAYLTSAEDFKKQRKRINRKLLRLRHELKIVTKDTKKFKDKTSQVTPEAYEKDARYGLLLLLTAERDLMYSSEIKSTMEISNENLSSYRQLMISKIKKALIHCKRLLAVISNESRKSVVLETFVYSALVQGLYSLNKKKWEASIHAYSVARCGLDYFLLHGDQTNLERAAIEEIMDSIVDPSLTFAISQMGHNVSDMKSAARKHCHDDVVSFLIPAVTLIQDLDSSCVSDITSEVNLIKSVSWRDHEATLYNDELSLKIMDLTQDDSWKDFSSADSYDAFITGWSSALDLHKADTEKAHDEDDMEEAQNRAIVLTYINYNLLFTTIKRDLLLIKELGDRNYGYLETYKDIHRLFSNVLRVTGEIKDLPGVYNDEDLYKSLERLEQFFEAKKIVTLGDAFNYSGKSPEALAIYSHVQKSLDPTGSYPISEFPYEVTSNSDYEEFVQVVNRRVTQAQVLAQFQQTKTNKYGTDNIYEYSDHTNAVNLKRDVIITPVLSKPVLFDIAFNYIGYDSASDKSAPTEVTMNDEDSKKRGLFGFFGGR